MVFTFTFLNDQSSLLLINNTVYKVKLIHDTKSCSENDYRTSTLPSVLNYELESALRSVLHLFLKGQELFPVQTPHLIFKPSVKPWKAARKLGFIQNGRTVQAHSDLLEIHIVSKRIKSSDGRNLAKSNRKRHTVENAVTSPGELDEIGISKPKRKPVVIIDSESESEISGKDHGGQKNESSIKQKKDRQATSKSQRGEIAHSSMDGSSHGRVTRSHATHHPKQPEANRISSHKPTTHGSVGPNSQGVSTGLEKMQVSEIGTRSLRSRRRLLENTDQAQGVRNSRKKHNFNVNQTLEPGSRHLRSQRKLLENNKNSCGHGGQKLRSSQNTNNFNINNIETQTSSEAIGFTPELAMVAEQAGKGVAATTPNQGARAFRHTSGRARRKPIPDQFAIQTEEMSEALKLQELAQPSQVSNQCLPSQGSPWRRSPRKSRRTSFSAVITSAIDYVILTPLKHLVRRK